MPQQEPATPVPPAWQTALAGLGALTSLVELALLVVQNQPLLVQPLFTLLAAGLVWAGVLAGGLYVLLRTRPAAAGRILVPAGARLSRKAAARPEPFYPRRQRWIAGGLLALNGLATLLVVLLIWLKPCLYWIDPVPAGEFGILIANYTQGRFRFPTAQGAELAARTARALQTRLATHALHDLIAVRQTCFVRDGQEAVRAGQSAGAALVVWGNVAEYAPDVFAPVFTLVQPLSWLADLDPLLFQVELNPVDISVLPSRLSARTTALSAFVIGLVALRENDFPHAVREFTFAIDNTRPDWDALAPGSEQRQAVGRSLAIFYVLRGRARAALGQETQALDDYDQAEQVDGNYPAVYVARGNHYYSRREFGRAEQEYRRALALDESPAAYHGLGNAMFYLEGRQAESENAYLRAIQLLEQHAQDTSAVRVPLCALYRLQGRWAEAQVQAQAIVTSESASAGQKQAAQECAAPTATPLPTSTHTPSPTWTVRTGTPATPRHATPSGLPSPAGTPTPRPSATASPTLLPTPLAEAFARVVEVLSGDTIRVVITTTVFTVRYLGIDAPQPGPVPEAYSQDALALNRRLVEGQVVRLVTDGPAADLQGNQLRYVFVDDDLINAEIVRQGLARVTAAPEALRYAPTLLESQAEAQQARRGVWNPATLTPTPTLLPTPSSVPPSPPTPNPFDRNGDGHVTCSDFSTRTEAQAALAAGYSGLDGDGDGVACESLPP